MPDQQGRWAVEAFARSFASLCEGTIATLLTETAGLDHLDVGCGTGSLAVAAAEMGRAVVAVDSDPGMVEYTRRINKNLDIREMTLPWLDFPSDRFDCVTANFVINHVADPRAAMGEMARVLRPGGQIAVTIWTNQPTAQSTLFAESLAGASAVNITGQGLPDHLDFERSVVGLADLAADAGLSVIAAHEVEWVWRTTWDDLWAGIAGGVASIGETFLAQTTQTRHRIEGEMRGRARKFEVNGSLELPSKAAYLVGVDRRSVVR